jgi:hypothetical protein
VADKKERITSREAVCLALAAGVWAAVVVLVVQLIFGKSPTASLLIAAPLAGSALLATLVVAPWLWRLSKHPLASALFAALIALAVTYLLFGLFNTGKDVATSSPSALSSMLALPMFVVFSLPIALPTTLLFAWAAHKLLRRRRQAIDAPA